jgi:hypothetical protein
MKNTDGAQPTLTLRKHSIRTLTPSELRVANGGGRGACSGEKTVCRTEQA